MADTAPSWVPKSVNRTSGARACARVHRNTSERSAAAGGRAARGVAPAAIFAPPRDKYAEVPRWAVRHSVPAPPLRPAYRPAAPVNFAPPYALPAPIFPGIAARLRALPVPVLT